MRNRSAFRTCLACVCLLAACAASARADATAPRVRPVDATVAAALSRGRCNSVTIAALIDALERSDLIVHIETRWFESHRVRAETRFIARAAGQRYVRISIDARIRDEAAIALLGHELQHAWEIAQARWVIDEAGLVELYGQIGHRAGGGDGRMLRVDTPAGPDIERQVFLELRGAQRRRSAELRTHFSNAHSADFSDVARTLSGSRGEPSGGVPTAHACAVGCRGSPHKPEIRANAGGLTRRQVSAAD